MAFPGKIKVVATLAVVATASVDLHNMVVAEEEFFEETTAETFDGGDASVSDSKNEAFVVTALCRDYLWYGTDIDNVAVVEQVNAEVPRRFMTYGNVVIGAQYMQSEFQGEYVTVSRVHLP